MQKPPLRKRKRRLRQGRWCVLLVLVLYLNWNNNAARFISFPQQHSEDSRFVVSEERPPPGFPIQNVLLLGQFSMKSIPVKSILIWHQIWSKYFQHIEVTGPFSKATQKTLRKAGINFRWGAPDGGYYDSYMIHLDKVLQYENDSTIEGILFLHDDALANLTKIWNPNTGTFLQNKDYIWTSFPAISKDWWRQSTFFLNLIVPATSSSSSHESDAFHFWEMLEGGGNPMDEGSLEKTLEDWYHWDFHCFQRFLPLFYQHYQELEGFAETARTDRFTRYRWHLAGHSQADFLYIPTRHAQLLRPLAQLMRKYRVFHECAVPTMMFWATMEYYKSNLFPLENPIINTTTATFANKSVDAVEVLSEKTLFSRPLQLPRYWSQTTSKEDFPSLRRLGLCTEWDGDRSSQAFEVMMLRNCTQREASGSDEYGVYHPLKMGITGPAEYETMLLELNRG